MCNVFMAMDIQCIKTLKATTRNVVLCINKRLELATNVYIICHILSNIEGDISTEQAAPIIFHN